MRTGTTVDATMIDAPSSTKKGNQWYFGMKAHIGVDSRSKLIHSVVATSANVHDRQVPGELLHGEETRVWGDSAYTGQREVSSRARPACPGPHAHQGQRKPGIDGVGTLAQSKQVEGTREGGTPVPGSQTNLRFSQSPLPKTGLVCVSSLLLAPDRAFITALYVV